MRYWPEKTFLLLLEATNLHPISIIAISSIILKHPEDQIFSGTSRTTEKDREKGNDKSKFMFPLG